MHWVVKYSLQQVFISPSCSSCSLTLLYKAAASLNCKAWNAIAWGLTSEELVRLGILRSSWIRRQKFQLNFFDSKPVNLDENVSPFFLFSENHGAKLLNSRTYFRLSLTHLQNFIRTQELGSSDNRVAAFNWLHGVYWIATLKMADHCCHALLVLCKGSGLMMSTYFPRGGGNSCLDLFWEINFVTLLLFFPRGSCKLFLKSSTFFATFNVVAR